MLNDEELMQSLRAAIASHPDNQPRRIEFPPLPQNGKYVIRECSGQVRAFADEMQVSQLEAEEMAAMFSVSCDVQLEFHLAGYSQLLSVWSGGRQVNAKF